MTPSRDISRLLEIMAALRDRDSGCPWDVDQTFDTIVPYTIEEAYEVAEAVAADDMASLCDELGDLLLQVVYHAQIASEAGAFAFPDVVEAITRKLIRRHPHVFGDADAKAAGAAKGQWDRIKAEEKRERGGEPPKSALDGVPVAIPATMRAVKLQDKAAKVGFVWPDARSVLAKIREEIDEVEHDIDANASREHLEGEIGDVLFALTNLARRFDVDPDQALRRTNAKFVKRFENIEERLAAAGRKPQDAALGELEALWAASKDSEL
jgi:nucleoside triphosphate diphosphatase